ncbi:MAG TPA: class I SAM-dependent methyltransferase [Candidatus Krumholzibacteria bacterium]
METRSFLHVGADCGQQPLPSHYRGWQCVSFDINPCQDADMVGDVRNMAPIADEVYDAVYLCHILNYFHPWELPQVLSEAARITKNGGFVEARVPHLEEVCRAVLDGHPMDTPLYRGHQGPITPQNLIHGRIGRTRNSSTIMAHRTSFTPGLLRLELQGAGLKVELLGKCSDQRYDLFAIGRKSETQAVDPIDELLSAVTPIA